ncbi:hypothetical protein AJ87_33585 [Rhizobium yanglingense]|nr:hypothetical protein AJ87_33585 [Rhizobium yanglingense]
MNLEIANQVVDAVAVRNQAWHDKQRACIFRNAFLELIADKPRRRHEEGQQGVEKTGRALRCRKREHDQQYGDFQRAHAGIGHEASDDRHRNDGKQHDGEGNRQPVELADCSNKMLDEGRTIIGTFFKLRPVHAGKKAADIRLMRLRLLGGSGFAGHVERQLGDFHFRQRRALGELFDLLAVFVA